MDGSQSIDGVVSPTSENLTVTIPSPPNPSGDTGIIPKIASPRTDAPSPPEGGSWAVTDVLPETAMKMLCHSVQSLINLTGDVPPTPPLSRPTTPRRNSLMDLKENRPRSNSRPATPVPGNDLKAPGFKGIALDSPEACMSEPSARVVEHDTEPLHIQQLAIARKFFSKRPPPVTLEQYLVRLQRYCPMSAAVWLAAGVYIHKLAVEDKIVPVTNRTVHRLVLASLRVAMKALEDLRYPQERFAGVGGVKESELQVLEISLCYLTEFDLQVNPEKLYCKMEALQQAGTQAAVVRQASPESFKLRLPIRAHG